ncbi:hypothetical protein [Crocosphaera sp. Alani8]|uniref:hypothetical protein n=1 Tax=Crocosphaera sp. Alani8 TaxID=3038952 RepID=UPI00313EEC48
MINEEEFKGHKPISFWNRHLGVNFKDIFKSLSKAVINGIVGKWDFVAKELVDVGAAIHLKERTVEEVVWLLVYRSLNQAIFSLIKDSQNLLDNRDLFDSQDLDIFDENIESDESNKRLDKLLEKLDLEKTLEQQEISIKQNFFSYPKQLEILNLLQPVLIKWLKNFVEKSEQGSKQAEVIASRLPTYFVFALNKEWRKNRQEASQKVWWDSPKVRGQR